MNVQELARRTEVQALAVFGILVLGGYYIYRKRFVDSTRWAKAVGPRPPKGFTCPKGFRPALAPRINPGDIQWRCERIPNRTGGILVPQIPIPADQPVPMPVPMPGTRPI